VLSAGTAARRPRLDAGAEPHEGLHCPKMAIVVNARFMSRRVTGVER
jgi:hypothetical protein